jgi:ribosome-binding factor A
MTHRHEQLAAAIDRGVREVFARGFQDPRIAGLLTVTEVKVTQDLKRAVVRVSVLPADKATLSLHGLSSAASYIRREVGELVRVRSMPELVFERDDTLKKQASVLSAIDRARDDLATRPPPPPPPATPPDDQSQPVPGAAPGANP